MKEKIDKGLKDGNGLTNGNGLVNGSGLQSSGGLGGYSHIELEGASNVARISAVAILLALLAGGGCVYYMIDEGESKGGISVDGSFEDWAGTETLLSLIHI